MDRGTHSRSRAGLTSPPGGGHQADAIICRHSSGGLSAIQAGVSPPHRAAVADMGLRLRAAKRPHAVHRIVVRATLVALFRGMLRVRAHEPKIVAAFPSVTRFESHVDDVVLDGWVSPFWRRFRSLLAMLRVFQQGSVQTYVLYILIILTLLLLLTMPLKETLREILGGESSTTAA